MIVTFDIADQAFSFYNEEEWRILVEEWRYNLEVDGYEFAEDMEVEEVVDCTWGEELFWERKD